ncbi:sulfotransferase family protein [Desulfoscipio geothermicus]|uniref:Sulfotransferase family protein n=1 Tax=Desulfoscipio geothermicus DSM 3669 TaxID=1121426 RepID=A0A1I6E8X3_9FIRM|nr:sulfotransferase [Desulfoscipio geothermicus]SFR14193.1 Sulfotransferase family protein [Desulfoscipio geothermicus DSM 3669]
MQNNINRLPIIIIGMHRSGTSMLTRMLEELGLFMGKEKESNHEALFFLRLNDWLLRQSGGAWDHPEPIKHLLNNTQVRALMMDYIRYMMKTPRVVSYLGWGKYLRYRTPANLDIPWGWKDPRNTYTLPIWLDLFPDAKVIHIYRNGVDVANSLKVRAEKILVNSKALYLRRKLLYWVRPKKGGFTHSLRCVNLSGGFSLWTDYLREAQSHVRSLGSNAIEIKYEDFLADPYTSLKYICKFCELEINDEIIRQVSGKVKKGRAYAYKDKPELQTFAAQVADRLKLFGY